MAKYEYRFQFPTPREQVNRSAWGIAIGIGLCFVAPHAGVTFIALSVLSLCVGVGRMVYEEYKQSKTEEKTTEEAQDVSRESNVYKALQNVHVEEVARNPNLGNSGSNRVTGSQKASSKKNSMCEDLWDKVCNFFGSSSKSKTINYAPVNTSSKMQKTNGR